MSESKKLRTRCYYTDYVNHAIRFYLSCPESLITAGKRKADIDNWIAVQSVFHALSDSDRDTILGVYATHHRINEAVRQYSANNNLPERSLWILLTKFWSIIAKRRGLI
ncbi:MAG: hypothetical protein J6Y60_03300 [Treponema sp.]|nr:hypothetical protein [Treponema sp.]